MIGYDTQSIRAQFGTQKYPDEKRRGGVRVNREVLSGQSLAEVDFINSVLFVAVDPRHFPRHAPLRIPA